MLFLIIAFLFPVAVYFSIFAAINRRTKPLMVSGTWDFAGLLFAVSGFLLITGPALVALFYQHNVGLFLLRGGGRDLPPAMAEIVYNWAVYWGLYYLFIVAGSVALFWWRSKSTVIYNIPPDVFETLLFNVLEQGSQTWKRMGKKVFFLGIKNTDSMPKKLTQEEKEEQELRIVGAERRVLEPKPRLESEESRDLANQQPETYDHLPHLVADVFPLFQNVTLNWHGKGLEMYRAETEEELRKGLETTYTEENPSSGWLFGISGLLFLVMIITTGMVILITLLTPRR